MEAQRPISDSPGAEAQGVEERVGRILHPLKCSPLVLSLSHPCVSPSFCCFQAHRLESFSGGIMFTGIFYHSSSHFVKQSHSSHLWIPEFLILPGALLLTVFTLLRAH